MDTAISTEQTSALAILEKMTPIQVFTNGALSPILERIKAEVRATETDISTEAGRKAIASTAYKIARSKTFIDEQRIALVGDRKRELAAIDAEGKRMRDELDALKEEFRKPLTDWENAEKNRVATHTVMIQSMLDVAAHEFVNAEQVAKARKVVEEIMDRDFQEFSKRANQTRDHALLHLDSEARRIADAEARKEEADRIRLEAAEKARIEREARVASEAKQKAEAEAKRREEAQARAAKQREDDLARAAAEEKARRIAAEEKAVADREAAVSAERKRQEGIRLEEQRKVEAEAREKARREADKAHRREIHDDAVYALVSEVESITNEAARAVVERTI